MSPGLVCGHRPTHCAGLPLHVCPRPVEMPGPGAQCPGLHMELPSRCKAHGGVAGPACLPLALRSSTHAHLLARPGVPDHSLLMAHSCTCSSFWPSCLLPHPSYLASFLLQKRTAIPDLHTFPTHTGPSRKTSALSCYHLLFQGGSCSSPTLLHRQFRSGMSPSHQYTSVR